MEEAWRAKSVQLRRSRLADEGAVREAEQRMQGAQQRAAQQQRERQQRDVALQVHLFMENQPYLTKISMQATRERALLRSSSAHVPLLLSLKVQM